jgi:hypothetical protein
VKPSVPIDHLLKVLEKGRVEGSKVPVSGVILELEHGDAALGVYTASSFSA